MPIYEYQCKKCGTVEEALQKFSDKPLTKCRHCTGKLHKLVSQSSFHLKGTGWYVTDYKNQSKETAAGSESEKKDANVASAKPEKAVDSANKTSTSSEIKTAKGKGANSTKKP
jgi:putative FmdB family regulatory protein